MRPRTVLVLAVVVVALAAFIRFFERDQPSSDERAQRAKKVLEVKKDEVSRIRLTAAGQTVVLERQAPPSPSGGGAAAAGAARGEASPAATPPTPPAADWRIAGPPAFAGVRADGAAVDRLLDSLVNLEKSRTLDGALAAHPSDLGLDKPRAAVALSLTGSRTDEVMEIGAPVPTSSEMIVALAGHPDAYAVSDALLTEVQKKAGDWRDRQVFHGDRDAIQRLSWSVAGAPRIVLARRGDRFWLDSPIRDRADRDQVEKLLTDLTGISAERFVDPPLPPAAQLGLDPPHVALEAALAGQGQPFSLQLGASHAAPASPPSPPPAGEPAPADGAAGGTLTYARAGSQLFETRSGLAATVGKPAVEWRSPLLSGFEVHQVEKVVVRDAVGAVNLERAGTDWKRGGVTVSYMPVSDLLFSVTEARADRLLSGAEAAAAGFAAGAKPLISFDLAAGAAGRETIDLFAALGGAVRGVPARSSGRGDTVLLLPEAKLKEIQDRVAALRGAAPLAPEKNKPATK